VIRTPMMDAGLKDWTEMGYGATEEDTYNRVLAMHPIGRFGEATTSPRPYVISPPTTARS